MADDKGAGGGGWQWDTFEIILILALAIALISKLENGKSLFSLSGEKTAGTAEKKEAVATYKEQCGLTISRPKPLEKVTTSVTLTGLTEGCDWRSTSTVAIYAQVIDSKGKPISPYTTITPREYADNMSSFSATIPILERSSGTGYVILIPAISSAQNATARIPIQLSK